EPTRFWSYVIAALQKIHRDVGISALAQLQSPSPPAIESILARLINDVDALDRDVTLILDDYHVIDAAPIHATMTFLLDRLPRRMHVVVTSRSEPPLALPRLRARSELT